jgi:flagellar biosynthesis/type III secretory pathway chaperone
MESKIKTELENLLKQKEQLLANLNALEGAIKMCEHLLKPEEKELEPVN